MVQGSHRKNEVHQKRELITQPTVNASLGSDGRHHENMTERIWTDRDYDKMSWHDNHVHGIRIVEGKYGAGELELDLDYITEWCNCEEGYEFLVLPAKLTFFGVTSLVISLDYKTPTAGLCPFSIDSIERRYEGRERYTAQLWKIEINWPKGSVEFEAESFVQKSVGVPLRSKEQYLDWARRGNST